MEEKKPNGSDNDLLDPNDFQEGESSSGDDKSKEGNPEGKEPNSEGKSTEELEKEEKKAKDAHFAKLRREKEAKEKADKEAQEKANYEQKIREEAKLQGKLEMAKVNTFTDEPITDEEDLRNFEIMLQLDKEGKDPINDFPKRLAEINRKKAEDAKKAQEEAEKEKGVRQSKIAAEIKELRDKYPELNTAELANDELFKSLQQGRAGRWTQVEIYELYLEKKAQSEAKEKETKSKQAVDEGAKKVSKTPSSSASGKTTSKSVADMSEEEFKEYWANKYGN